MSRFTSLRVSLLLAAVVPLAACETIPESAPATEVAQTPEGQLAQIMDWWPGDYNNDAQLARLEAEGKPIWRTDDTGKGGHIEVASHYRTVDLPAFGENVLYLEEIRDGDPSNIFRQRIYSLAVDPETNAVRVTLWNFKDRKKYVGAYQDLSRLNDLTPDQMTNFGRNCDLVTRVESDKYHLGMNGKDCAFGENYFAYQVLLGPDTFWFRDKIAKVSDDSIVSVAGDYTYHELDRVN